MQHEEISLMWTRGSYQSSRTIRTLSQRRMDSLLKSFLKFSVICSRQTMQSFVSTSSIA